MFTKIKIKCIKFKNLVFKYMELFIKYIFIFVILYYILHKTDSLLSVSGCPANLILNIIRSISYLSIGKDGLCMLAYI